MVGAKSLFAASLLAGANIQPKGIEPLFSLNACSEKFGAPLMTFQYTGHRVNGWALDFL